jgi:Ni,Fe-hydrogenase III large subunit/Ni,Fe-hydrogenase III component G
MAASNADGSSTAAKYASAILLRMGERVSACHVANGNEVHVFLADKSDIPEICSHLQDELVAKLCSLVSSDERQTAGAFMLRYIFEVCGKEDVFVIVTAKAKESSENQSPSIPSIAMKIPIAVFYEREIRDLFGIGADGNPDTRSLVLHDHWPDGVYPLRKDFDIKTKVTRAVEKEYHFTKVEGEGICEIPVGPVHAGIIEPGHFRFSILGENIINLETKLFYTHKGVEKLAETMKLDQALLLSERISGDESVANSLAYCQALEKIADADIPKRALQIRCVCAEMERIYNHLGTLAGISTDVGFAYGSARLSILKERMMQLNSEISGSRLLFGVNRIGGVGIDLDDTKLAMIKNTTRIVREDFERIVSMLRAKSSVTDRLRNTGIVSKKVATDLGLVGVVARAAGLDVDTRRDHPYADYPTLSIDTHHDTPQNLMEYKVNLEKRKGDALGRFEVRVEEVMDSLRMIGEIVSNLHGDKMLAAADTLERIEPFGHALGYAESHRGQTIHWLMVGQDRDSLFRYKVRTASFVNWPGIEEAVLSDIVPDFPVINKSLDLSYSGNDL